MLNVAQASGVVRKTITPSDVHVNRPLTNVSLAMMQAASMFVSDRIFPRVPVMKQSDLYIVYPHGDWNRDEMKKRAPSTETAGGGYNIEMQPYYCPVWGVHRDVDDQLRANADEPINVDREATMWVTQKGLIRREVEFATKYFTPGAWTNYVQGVGTGTPGAGEFLQWNDAASEPVKDIKRWRDQFLLRNGVAANVLLLGHETYTALTENDAIIDRIKYGQTPGAPAMVTRQALAALFEIDRIEVMSAIVNTAPEGVPHSNAFIGNSKGALLVHAAPTPGLMTPSAGYSFVWAGYAGAGEYGQRVSSFRMDPIRSDRFELELAFTHEKVADDLGLFIEDAIA